MAERTMTAREADLPVTRAASVELLPITPAIVAAAGDADAFRRAVGAELGAAEAMAREIVAQTEAHRVRTGGSPEWGGFLVVDPAATRTVVGTGGFVGAPDARGEVEIAYGTFPSFEGRGYAKATANALFARAAASGAVRVVYAHTLPRPGASPSILRGLGFRRSGTAIDPDEGEVWRWERRVAAPDPRDGAGNRAAHEAPELRTGRVIDATRERVYRAFSDPGELARWWGPRGFTSSFHEFDFRPGGDWRFVMHGPDGAHFENHSVFVELVEPERVVLDHLSSHWFRLAVTLTAESGRTRIDWRMSFETEAERERMRALVSEANEQNLDRLEALVAEES